MYQYPEMTDAEREMDYGAATQSMRIRLGCSLKDARRYVTYHERMRIPVPISLSLKDLKIVSWCLRSMLLSGENPPPDSQDFNTKIAGVLRNLDSQVRWIMEKI